MGLFNISIAKKETTQTYSFASFFDFDFSTNLYDKLDDLSFVIGIVRTI
jgi:hypothetical protein